LGVQKSIKDLKQFGLGKKILKPLPEDVKSTKGRWKNSNKVQFTGGMKVLSHWGLGLVGLQGRSITKPVDTLFTLEKKFFKGHMSTMRRGGRGYSKGS